MKNCGDGGAGGSRAGCRGLRPLPGFGAAPQNLCRSTTSQALRAAKGRKKRGSFHPHRFPHPPPPLVSLPSQISAFCALPRAALVFAHAFRSLCHLRWQVPTGHTLPFGPPSGRFAAFGGNSPPGRRFPPRHRADASLRCPKTCAAAQPRKRCERPKAARNAAHSTRIVFAPAIRGRRGIIPPAAHLFAPLRQGFAPCAPKPAIKPYQQRSQSP